MTSEYFAHDYDARNDPKVVQLVIEQGAFGIACYWIVIEILHSVGGEIDRSKLVKLVCHYLHEPTEKVQLCIHKMIECELFTDDDTVIRSHRVIRNLLKRKEVAEKRSNAASKRYANAEQMQSKSNANAGKVKVKDKVKDKVKEDIPPLPPLTGGLDYPEMQRAWSDYVEYRKQRKPKMTPKAAERLFARLERAIADGIDPVEALDYAMSQSWQGVFLDKLPSKPKDYDQFRQWVEECYDKQEAMTRYAAYPQGRFAREWWDAMMQSGFTERGHPIKNWRQHVKSYIDQAMAKVPE